MLKRFSLTLTLFTLLLHQTATHARGRGVYSYLLTADGKLAAELGETRSDLLDPAAFVIFRYREGRVTAAPLDQPDAVLWTAKAQPQMPGLEPYWRLLPELLVIVGEDSFTGLDRVSGKAVYVANADHFARNLYFLTFAGESDTPPAPTLFLIDDSQQEEFQLNRKNKPPTVAARLARFDLRTGKFLWKASIVTPAGEKLRPLDLDPRGLVRGECGNDFVEFGFDPATGLAKVVDRKKLEALEAQPAGAHDPAAAPRPRVHIHGDKIEYRDAAGKTLWSRVEPGVKGDPLPTADTLVIPVVTERSTTQVITYDTKDGSERWRCKLPAGFFADSVTVEVSTVKTGYLVQVHWIVLD
jgi:hypothetical protein